MLETPEELSRLQSLLNESMASAGPHLRSIITDEVAARLPGMRLLVLATATADGRPVTGPVDGYFLQGTFWISSGPESVRLHHLAARPAVSDTHLPGRGPGGHGARSSPALSHDGPAAAGLRQAMLDEYLPKQGPSFEEWLAEADALAARIAPAKMFTFHLGA
jgi:hypothetical protein